MKSVVWAFICWLAAAGALRADYVVKQSVQSGGDVAFVTMQFKGDQARIDMPDGTGQMASLVMNLKTDELVNLLTSRQMAYRGVLSKQREKTESAMKRAGLDIDALKPVATGKKEKVGQWEAEEFVLEMQGFTIRMWVARDFPKGYEIKTQMARFSRANSGGGLNPDAMNLPGMVVKSEAPGPAGPMVTTLISAKEEPVPTAAFEIPPSFQQRELPSALGGQ